MADDLSLRPDSTTARWACAVAIAALVVAIYAPVRHHEFLDYDDMIYLVWNPALEPASLGNALRLAVERPLGSWIPLTVVSRQLDRKVFGRDAGGPLLGNVALHALGSIVLLFALHRLTGRLGASAWVAAFALAFTVDEWLRTSARRRVAAAVGTAAIAALSAVAIPQVAFWRDSRSLYGRMHDVHPDAAFPELRLGMVEAIDGDIAAAASHIDRAYQLDPEVGAHAAYQLGFLA